MRRDLITIAIAGMLVLILATAAMAQDDDPKGSFDAQLFRPSIFGGSFLSIEGVPTHWPICYGLGLYFNYAHTPMRITFETQEDSDGIVHEGEERNIIDYVFTTNLTFMFSATRWFAIGFDMPFHYSYGWESENTNKPLTTAAKQDSSFGLGDLKLEVKFTALNLDQYPVGLAFATFATVPTGSPDRYLGEGAFGDGTRNFLLGEKILMEIDAKYLNIGINAGYQWREQRSIMGVPLGSAFLYGAGISKDYKVGKGWLGYSLELFGSYQDSSSIEVSQDERTQNPEEIIGYPAEVMATLRYTLDPSKVRFIGGGGTAVSPGLGSPGGRGVFGIDWFPDCIPPTTGLLIVDVVTEQNIPIKKAVLVVKKQKTGNFKTDDMGHFEREASPGDYKISAAAKGYKPGTGSGTVVAGKTTNVRIVLKEIPKPTELTVQVVHKKSGKPITGSGILVKDPATGKIKGLKAPEGTWSGEFDPGKFIFTGIAKGYERVDQEADVVKETKNTVIIKLRRKIIKIGKVQFAYDSAKLLPPAFPVLKDVVRKIKEADFEFKQIIIEGHTSAEGTDEYNMKLSERRANSVRNYLIKKGGLSADMLTIEAFGESRTIAPDTEEGREVNRRVEFIFEE